MADDRVIRVKIIAAEGGNSAPKKDGGGGLGDVTRALHPVRHLLSEVTEKNELVGYFFTQAVNNVSKAAKSEVNRYYTLREDYLSQKTLENVNTAVSKVQGLGMSALTGASAGSFTGPVGTVVGAVVGVASWGVQEFIAMRNTGSNYYQQLNGMNFQTSFGQVRAGLVDNGRGTEN